MQHAAQRADHALQRWMDLCQQAADAIAGLCDLASQIFVKATQHRQLRDFVFSQFHRAKRMRHATGGLGNDVRVPRVGLRFTRVQIGNAPHRKSRQVRNPHPFCLSHRDRKCSDCGRLIHDKQDLAVFFQLSDQRSQLRFIIGQRAIQKALALTIQCHGMMRSFADVKADEDFDLFMLFKFTHNYSQG